MQRSAMVSSPRPSTEDSAWVAASRFEEPGFPSRTISQPVGHPGELGTAIDRALRATGYPALRKISIQVVEGFVCLRGSVPSYYMKQKAQSEVMQVPGVNAVRNEIDVAASTCGSS